MIVKAKRYLADHYDDAELTLFQVAEHVGLSENISRIGLPKRPERLFQLSDSVTDPKAKELLRTTTFKSYEIGEW